MMFEPARVTFQRVMHDGQTSWDVLYAGCVICRVKRTTSLGRGYSKSQMSTRHVAAWRGSVKHVLGLSDIERRAVQRELDSRDKTTREMAVRHVFASYEQAQVPLPLGLPAQAAA
jgi:hypothetical protein